MKRAILTAFVGSFLMTSMAQAQALSQVYRFFNGRNHLYATSIGEGQQLGYQYEGPVFKVYASPNSATKPLYKCFFPQHSEYFISQEPNCEGRQYVGILGYVVREPLVCHPPLHRFYRPQDHLVTVNPQEGYNAGYQLEGVIGYAPN